MLNGEVIYRKTIAMEMLVFTCVLAGFLLLINRSVYPQSVEQLFIFKINFILVVLVKHWYHATFCIEACLRFNFQRDGMFCEALALA